MRYTRVSLDTQSEDIDMLQSMQGQRVFIPQVQTPITNAQLCGTSRLEECLVQTSSNREAISHATVFVRSNSPCQLTIHVKQPNLPQNIILPSPAAAQNRRIMRSKGTNKPALRAKSVPSDQTHDLRTRLPACGKRPTASSCLVQTRRRRSGKFRSPRARGDAARGTNAPRNMKNGFGCSIPKVSKAAEASIEPRRHDEDTVSQRSSAST